MSSIGRIHENIQCDKSICMNSFYKASDEILTRNNSVSSFACMHTQPLQSCPTLRDPMDCSPPGSSVHGILQVREYWSGLPCPPPGYLPNPGIEPASLVLQVDSFTHWATWRATDAFILVLVPILCSYYLIVRFYVDTQIHNGQGFSDINMYRILEIFLYWSPQIQWRRYLDRCSHDSLGCIGCPEHCQWRRGKRRRQPSTRRKCSVFQGEGSKQ